MSLVNSTNSQFNQTSVNSKQGVVCAGQSGGGFGSINNSIFTSNILTNEAIFLLSYKKFEPIKIKSTNKIFSKNSAIIS